ncbi:hypothetical protein K504DRAFT_81485 [Pleomassaria siparia CBS 279.74]|uniref:Uncharacterized protein n=1 Tax=Pleomassaria siparia CBS 279.74 TaxID=1314801 RepID=A0A6G1K233_9PLEO|nr:hypothetical protein K504DRAFT_81485 [Pleomassaria siparia CBS 279.74]
MCFLKSPRTPKAANDDALRAVIIGCTILTAACQVLLVLPGRTRGDPFRRLVPQHELGAIVHRNWFATMIVPAGPCSTIHTTRNTNSRAMAKIRASSRNRYVRKLTPKQTLPESLRRVRTLSLGKRFEPCRPYREAWT